MTTCIEGLLQRPHVLVLLRVDVLIREVNSQTIHFELHPGWIPNWLNEYVKWTLMAAAFKISPSFCLRVLKISIIMSSSTENLTESQIEAEKAKTKANEFFKRT